MGASRPSHVKAFRKGSNDPLALSNTLGPPSDPSKEEDDFGTPEQIAYFKGRGEAMREFYEGDGRPKMGDAQNPMPVGGIRPPRVQTPDQIQAAKQKRNAKTVRTMSKLSRLASGKKR